MPIDNYEQIDIPYNSNLERSEQGLLADVEPQVGAGIINNPGQISPNAIREQQIGDLQITNWIKSRNYQPKVSGFLLRGSDGYIEANKLFIGSGGIIGGKLDIPDDTTANSFHVEVDGDTFWGTTPALFTTNNDNANAYVLKTGVAKFQSVTLSGSVAISGIANNTSTDIALLEATHDLVFSVTDADTIAWASGTINLSNGRSFSIDAGNTGNMAALTYIYLDPGTSSTVLQTTTTYSTAIGANKLLIGDAQNQTTTASYIPFTGGGKPLLDGEQLGALSVSTAVIGNAVITNAKINTMAVSKLTAGIIDGQSIVLDSSSADGEIRSGIAAGDFANSGANSGFIIGADFSDSSKGKFFLGSPTEYMKFDGTNTTVTFPINVDISFTIGVPMTELSLISHWRLEENSGTRVDATATGNDLTDNATVTSGTGKVGTAAQFTAANSEYLEIVDGSQTNLDQAGDMAISCWVNFDSTPSSGNGMVFASKWNGTTDNASYRFALFNNGGTLQLEYANDNTNDGASNDPKFARVNWTPSTGTWYHVVAVYDASAGEVDFYVDGVQLGSTQTGMHTSQNDTAAAFRIGALENDSEFMNGLIDELGFYDAEISSNVVFLIDNGGTGLTYTQLTNDSIAVDDAVGLGDAPDGNIRRINAKTAGAANSFMGIATTAGDVTETIAIRTEGKITGLSGLTAYITQYLSDTLGELSDSAGTVSKIVGRTLSTTELQVKYAIT